MGKGTADRSAVSLQWNNDSKSEGTRRGAFSACFSESHFKALTFAIKALLNPRLPAGAW